MGSAEHFFGILQNAGGGEDVVIGRGDADFIVTEFEGKFTGPEKLLVLPADGIVVGGEAGKPLGNAVDPIAVFGEEFGTGATAEKLRRIDVVLPVDAELDASAGG